MTTAGIRAAVTGAVISAGIALSPMLLTACGGTGITGSGTAATQTRHLDAFSGVDLAASCNVTIQVGGRPSVVVRADDNLLRHPGPAADRDVVWERRGARERNRDPPGRLTWRLRRGPARAAGRTRCACNLERLRPDRHPRDGHPAGIGARQRHHHLQRPSRARDHAYHWQRNRHPAISSSHRTCVQLATRPPGERSHQSRQPAFRL